MITAVDVMAYLAREIAPGRSDILFVARDAGLSAAVRAYFAGSRCLGGCGRDDDGVFRRWDFDERHHIQYRVGTFDADPVVVPLRDVLAWALDRIDHTRWVELERLRQARSDALHAEYGDRDLDHRMTYRPKDVTADERARVVEANSRRTEIEQVTRDLVARALADGSAIGQIDLFDSGTGDPVEVVEFPVEAGQFVLFAGR